MSFAVCLCVCIPEGRTWQQGACRASWVQEGMPSSPACLHWQLPGHNHQAARAPGEPRLAFSNETTLWVSAVDLWICQLVQRYSVPALNANYCCLKQYYQSYFMLIKSNHLKINIHCCWNITVWTSFWQNKCRHDHLLGIILASN